MAEPRDMTTILNNVEEDLKHPPTPLPTPHTTRPSSVVESFAPQRHRNAQGASDSMEQIQQDFRKSLAEMESRSKTIFDELKRVVG